METFKIQTRSKLSDFLLKNAKGMSYTLFQKTLRNKDIKVNGARVKQDVIVNPGDLVEAYYTPIIITPFEVVYSDKDVVVIYKKSGYQIEEVTLSLSSQFNGATAVHRLDRNTDGIMIFALNKDAENALLKGFKNRDFNKVYKASVKGILEEKQAVLTAYLVKDKEASSVKIFDRKVEGSVEIKTGYEVISEHTDYSELRVKLFTGKTHQIRAHLAHIGHPIIGDGKYGDYEFNKKMKAKTQRLTAIELTLSFDKDSYLYRLNGRTFSI